jgi:hypothetical protein
MLKPVATTTVDPSKETTRRINIVLNWFEELNERVPIK